jgi:hypothetical protein
MREFCLAKRVALMKTRFPVLKAEIGVGWVLRDSGGQLCCQVCCSESLLMSEDHRARGQRNNRWVLRRSNNVVGRSEGSGKGKVIPLQA